MKKILLTLLPYWGVQIIISFVWFSVVASPINAAGFYMSILTGGPMLWAIVYCLRQAFAAEPRRFPILDK